MHSPDELKALVEEALEQLELWPELHGQAESVRYALEIGGKRVRPVIALAVGEALGAPVEQVMPAALAIELVHNFSLVHDDLPAMDDDEERRGQPRVVEAVRRGRRRPRRRRAARRGVPARGSYQSPAVARELAEATLGMIGGQYLDTMVAGLRPRGGAPAEDRPALLRVGDDGALGGRAAARRSRRRGARSRTSSGCCSRSSTTSSTRTATSREHGAEGARRYADEAAERARAQARRASTPTRRVLRDIVDGLAVRTA